MGREILSTARPTRLRLAGFLATTLGGLLLGLGSLMSWATVEPFDTPTRGTDLCEGWIALAAGTAILVGTIVMRLLATLRARRIAAALILTLGLLAAALAALDITRARSRFTDSGQRDRLAKELAAQLHEPYADVRAELEAVFAERFQVSLEPGIFLVLAGGVLGALGGVLGSMWVSRPSRC
ncbi:MAG: hypothetical protein AB1551_04030 [Actinomycetota bacterium]